MNITDLITEARELCEKAMALEIPTERLDYSTEYVPLVDAIHIIPELCDALESYKSFADQIAKLPDCNDCASNRDCPYLPNWGTTTRINCPLHKPLPAPPEEGAERERD